MSAQSSPEETATGSPDSVSALPISGARTACQAVEESDIKLAACDRYVMLAGDTPSELAPALSSRAMAKYLSDRPHDALLDAEAALRVTPSDEQAKRLRAMALGADGEYNAALNAFRRLEYQHTDTAWHGEIAMLEYMIGDRARAVAFFHQAAADLGNSDTAAFFRYYAAIVEMELAGKGTEPILSLDPGSVPPTPVPALRDHRLGKLTDSELLGLLAEVPQRAKSAAECAFRFEIGHHRALRNDLDSARNVLEVAAEVCPTYRFEYHAARKWLKQLGG